MGTPLFSCVAFENRGVQLEMILGESQTAWYAWALMPNWGGIGSGLHTCLGYGFS
jgi:hypothetical protein